MSAFPASTSCASGRWREAKLSRLGTAKEDPARNAGGLRTRPWSVVVDGECEAPGRIDIEDLIKPQSLEERIYLLSEKK
jgi:DMSO/TMAO reductase YedYZ molybdopterin-dependent catalytic subunit